MSKCTNCGHEEEEEQDHEDHNEPEQCDDCGSWNCMCSEIDNCHCGAWKWSSTKNEMVRISDCIC
jgi:hypothetical protein